MNGMIPDYEVPSPLTDSGQSMQRIDAMFIMNGLHPISGHALSLYAPQRTSDMPVQPPGGRLF